MSDVVFDVAVKFELENRVNNQDFRRLIFSKRLELMSILDARWYAWHKREIELTLINSPFDDG